MVYNAFCTSVTVISLIFSSTHWSQIGFLSNSPAVTPKPFFTLLIFSSISCGFQSGMFAPQDDSIHSDRLFSEISFFAVMLPFLSQALDF